MNTNQNKTNSTKIKLDLSVSTSIADALAEDTEVLTEYQLDDPNVISLDELSTELGENVPYYENPGDPRTPLESIDAQDVSGHMSDPESDDDVLANAQQMGIGLEETDEELAELNIAETVAKAEKEHWER